MSTKPKNVSNLNFYSDDIDVIPDKIKSQWNEKDYIGKKNKKHKKAFKPSFWKEEEPIRKQRHDSDDENSISKIDLNKLPSNVILDIDQKNQSNFPTIKIDESGDIEVPRRKKKPIDSEVVKSQIKPSNPG